MKIYSDLLSKFAQLSGDYNPIHLDQKYATTSFFKHTIVYGVLQVFLAFEQLSLKKPFSLKSIQVKFLAPILTHENFYFKIQEIKNCEYHISIFNQNKIYTQINFSFITNKNKKKLTFIETIFDTQCNSCTKGGGIIILIYFLIQIYLKNFFLFLMII